MNTQFQLDERSRDLIANNEEMVLQQLDQALLSILTCCFDDDIVVNSSKDIRVYQEESWPRIHLELRNIDGEYWVIDRRTRRGVQILPVLQDSLKESFEEEEVGLMLGLLMISLGWCTVNDEGHLRGQRAAVCMKKQHMKYMPDLVDEKSKLLLRERFNIKAFFSVIECATERFEPTRLKATVQTDLIDFDPRNFRQDLGNLEEFTVGLENHGILHDPTLVPKKDGRYDVLLGERRVRGAKSMKLVSINAVISTPAPVDVTLLRIAENLEAKRNDHLELAKAFEMAYQERSSVDANFRRKDIVPLVHVSETQLSKYHKLLSIPESYHDRIRHLEMEKLLIIAGADREEEREDLMSKALEGQTVKTLRKARTSSAITGFQSRTVYNDITVTIKAKSKEVDAEELRAALENAMNKLTQ